MANGVGVGWVEMGRGRDRRLADCPILILMNTKVTCL